VLTLSTLHSPHAQNTNPTTTRLGSECLSNLPQHMSGSCMALCQHLPQRPHSAPHLRPGSACRNIAGHCCCPGEGSHASGNTCGYTRGWRSVLDEACTHSSSLAACETLFTSGAEFGEMTSPAQSGRAQRGGAWRKTAHLHHAEGGKQSAELLDSSRAPGGHTQGPHAPRGSDLACRAFAGRAHSPGGHRVKKARKTKSSGPNGNSMTAETMVPAVELLEQALVPDGRERTTVRTILDILSVLIWTLSSQCFEILVYRY